MKIFSIKYTIISITMLCGSSSFCQNLNPYDLHDSKTFVKQCNNGEQIILQNLLNQRIPYASLNSNYSLPTECKTQLQFKLKQFEKEDIDKWEQLSNQACSHKEGWVEKVPGTCQAGGPPPICPQQHWVKEPQEAMNRWQRLQNDVLRKREEESKSIACDCWAENIDKSFELEANIENTNTNSENGNITNPSSSKKSDIVIPCYGDCPPGLECKNGFCVEKTTVKKVYEKSKEIYDNPVVNKAVGKVKTYYIGQLLLKLSPILSKLYKGINISPIGIAIGVMQSPALDTWSNAYNSELRTLNNDIDKLKILFAEYDRAKANLPNCFCRAAQNVKIDILALKNKMNVMFKTINISYSGILTEKISTKNSCDKAFTVYHKWFCYYYLKIASISTD